jgi:hypothetical protein
MRPLLGFPPKVFLIGALRTGSTYLASLLDKHPEICLSNPKEPGFFTCRSELGEEWYRARFKEPKNKILIDATAWYSAGPTKTFRKTDNDIYLNVPQKIHATSPDAKFIYILRDPIARIHSLYWFLYRKFLEIKPFSVAIRENAIYLSTSDYFGQIENYLKFFPNESIKILQFENLIQDPNATANECFRFLGLTAMDIDISYRHHEKNASYQYRFLLEKIGRLFGDSEIPELIYRGARKMSPKFTHHWIENLLFREKPPLREADEQYLRDQLRETIRRLNIYINQTDELYSLD